MFNLFWLVWNAVFFGRTAQVLWSDIYPDHEKLYLSALLVHGVCLGLGVSLVVGDMHKGRG